MKRMKAFLGLIACLFVLGCKGPQIINDPFPEAIKSGFYNAEILTNTRSAGIKVLMVNKDTDPKTISFKFYGAHEGDYYVYSRKCGISRTGHYLQGNYTEFKLSEFFDKFNQNCFITIQITPVLPKQEDSTYSVSGSMGALYVRVLPDNYKYELTTNFGKFIQLEELAEDDLSKLEAIRTAQLGPLMVVNSTPGTKLGVFNCIDGPDKPLEIDVPLDGKAEIDIDRLHKPGNGCIVQLKDKAGGFSPFIINVYKKGYVPLAEPIVRISKKKLQIKGSRYVSLTDINGEPFYGSNADVRYEGGKEYIIRQYTKNGRMVVCEFKDGTKTCLRR